MARLSRRNELLLGVLVLCVSVSALALVLKLLVWPEMRHREQLHLVTRVADDVAGETYGTNNPNFKCKQRAPCCLQLMLLFGPLGKQPQFTSFVNLPYGLATATTPELSRTEACTLGSDFLGRLGSTPVTFIDPDDNNNVYFNISSGANIAEYWQTWPGNDPAHPSLYVEVERGEGVTVGAGFLLAVSCAGILLSSFLLLLRLYDDCHTVPNTSATEEKVRRSDFSPLTEAAADDEVQFARDMERGGPLRGTLNTAAGPLAGGRAMPHSIPSHKLASIDIELEEHRLAHLAEMVALERKFGEPDSPSALGRETRADAVPLASPTVPRIAPPPAAASARAPQSAADADDLQQQEEMDLDAFELEMQQHNEQMEERKEAAR